MTDTKEALKVKKIVVPQPLEDFFAEKLRARYAERSDVEVIIDRRDQERRGGNGSGPEGKERRATDRRVRAGWWALPEFPFEDEKAS